jgi:hypothetical protein
LNQVYKLFISHPLNDFCDCFCVSYLPPFFIKIRKIRIIRVPHFFPSKKFCLTFFQKNLFSKKFVYLCVVFVTYGGGCNGLIVIIIRKKRHGKRSKKIWKIEEKSRKIEENLKAD